MERRRSLLSGDGGSLQGHHGESRTFRSPIGVKVPASFLTPQLGEQLSPLLQPAEGVRSKLPVQPLLLGVGLEFDLCVCLVFGHDLAAKQQKCHLCLYCVALSREVIVRGCLSCQVAPFLVLWLDTADFVEVFCRREGSFSGIMGVSRLLVSSAKSGIYRAETNQTKNKAKENKQSPGNSLPRHCSGHEPVCLLFLTFQFFNGFCFFGWLALVLWFYFTEVWRR